MRILDHARIPELPNPYFGKVRDCYDLPATPDEPRWQPDPDFLRPHFGL